MVSLIFGKFDQYQKYSNCLDIHSFLVNISKYRYCYQHSKLLLVQVKHRAKYTERDILEAVRLVKEEDYSINKAAIIINSKKKNEVLRMTLSNRLRNKEPDKKPKLGRPVELSEEVEKALVKCLKMCADFNYPMRKGDLQDLVQNYCNEHTVDVRWKNLRPGKHWVRAFRKRWQHEVKMKKPKNIKRSRAKVSPQVTKDFFKRLAPNLENIPATHLFNCDETNLRDDPEAELAFFSARSKYHEKVMDASKQCTSVMFCCSAAGEMLPPMVVFKSVNGSLYKCWCENGPANAVYAATKSGWLTTTEFNQWFSDVFLVHIRSGWGLII